MDSLESEVGQKMRCAVKAKLLELGTGGSAGYIDDELPDYVMIMVANKRSKQQMIEDLNLFLGTHTEVFVTWLHQVLEKLQQVTLPSNLLSQKSKRKMHESGEGSQKKEKKDKKKEKKMKKEKDKSPEATTSGNLKVSQISSSSISSITDVFANHLLQTVSKQTDQVTKSENSESNSKSNRTSNNNDFDIPTITEISGNTTNAIDQESRKKDLEELEILQKRINLAKRQLRTMGSEESEDEDFLKIKDDDLYEELEDKNENNNAEKNRRNFRNPSPIIFDSKNSRNTSKNDRRNYKIYNNEKNQEKEKLEVNNKSIKKTSILDRLGNTKRAEKELFVPSFRKKELEKEKNLRDRSRKDKERNHEQHINLNKPKGQRIGSHVIVAPPKADVVTDEEEIDVPVNSVVKIKPRPVIPPHKQASKNLLLRAVAEAQRSTSITNKKVSKTIEKEKLLKSNASNLNKKTIKSNIIIEIPTQTPGQDEYIPEPIRKQNDCEYDEIDDSVAKEVYIPRSINLRHRIDIRDKSNLDSSRTQFVVTLDGMYEKQHQITTQISDKKSNKSRVEGTIKKLKKSSTEYLKRDTDTPPLNDLQEVNSSPIKKSTNTTSTSSKKDSILTTELRNKSASPKIEITSTRKRTASPAQMKTKSVKKLIITNDTTDDEKDLSSPTKEKQQKKWSKLSPISFDLNKKNDESNKSKNEDSGTKYDKIPPLLSAVNIPDLKTKQKERCKYYPACRQGESCEFYHPSTPCKTFPNCKFGDKCLYIHPNCKYDMTCTRVDCNFTHTRSISTAPPLASHVVLGQNFKTITTKPLPALCKFYPGCSNSLCTFYHPKPCRFGKDCFNKIECNFYHHDLPTKDKLKWISPNNV